MPIDTEIAKEQWLRYEYMRDNGHMDYVVKANKCDDFFLGFQWDPIVKAQLDAQRRPALTINKILATMSNVMGDQIQMRADTTFKPTHTAGEDLSNVLELLFRQGAASNDMLWLESEVFADGGITSRGFFDLRLGFDRNAQGEVTMTVPNPRNVIIDPDAEEYDPDTWKDVVHSKWLSTNDIAVLFNQDDAEYLGRNNTNPYLTDIDSVQRVYERFGGVGHYYAQNYVARDLLRNIRVIERQHKKLAKRKFFVDLETGDMREVPEGWNRERIKFAMDNFGFGVVDRIVERIRWTTTAGPCVLHDDWSPYKHFTQVPFFPYFRRGRTMGIVENLLDPQELLNKTSSQELHIVNTTANSGWKVKKGSLQNMTADELEQRGAQTGVVFELESVDDMEKIQPNQIPTGIERITYKAEEHIKTISNIDDNALGQDREDVSSKAIKAKRERGSVNQLKVMDNLNHTRKILARNWLDIVQAYYTGPRMYRITFANPHAQLADGGQDEFIGLNQFDEVTGQIKNDITIGTYDIVISAAPAKDTADESEFEQAMSLRELGIQIPDDVLISHSLLRDKRDLIKRLADANSSPEMQQQKQLALQGQQAGVDKLSAEADETKANALLKTASAQEKVAGMLTAAPEQPGSEGGKDLISQVLQNHAQAAAQASDQAHEAAMKGLDHAHEVGMEREKRVHEAGMEHLQHQHAVAQAGVQSAAEQRMAASEHQHSKEQAELGAKHAEKQQKAATEGAIKVAKAKPQSNVRPTSKGAK